MWNATRAPAASSAPNTRNGCAPLDVALELLGSSVAPPLPTFAAIRTSRIASTQMGATSNSPFVTSGVVFHTCNPKHGTCDARMSPR
eukprot:4727440-Pyramimonas_sp.AAC.3